MREIGSVFIWIASDTVGFGFPFHTKDMSEIIFTHPSSGTSFRLLWIVVQEALLLSQVRSAHVERKWVRQDAMYPADKAGLWQI